jgi:hypothetical protein
MDRSMQLYLPKSFRRDAESKGVTDEDCREAIRKAERGLIDADLGGGLIKQRIATGNRGASKGSRAVVFYKRGELAVFLHIFAKSRKSNLTKSESAEYLKFARSLEGLTNVNLVELVATQGWRKLEL